MDFATVVPPYVAKPLQLRPFRAVMLAASRVGDPASARALARPYRDVADRLTEWISLGRATRDDSAALYLHEYTSAGLTVRGLVGSLVVARRAHDAESRAVWPHEAIHPDQAADLAARMEEMDLNPAPILLVHDGSHRLRELVSTVATAAPDWSFVDRAGQSQRIWAIRDADVLAAIDAELAGGHCLLADGHHRYAAYLALQEAHPGTPWDSGLAMLVDQGDTPLFLGAIHRTFEGTTLAAIEAAAVELDAGVVEREPAAGLTPLDTHTAVVTDGDRWLALTPPAREGRALVEWVHDILLPVLPGQPVVTHHHTVEEALAAARCDAPSLLLPSPSFDEVRSIIETGRLLPEKATSFQPKPSLGVLMRPVHDG
jgi:uncharacterized protein (DUF1015 family)